MSTTANPNTVTGTLGTLLQILQSSNGYITMGIQVAGVLVPLGKALIKKIESIGQGAVTITFNDLVIADQSELDTVISASNADLAAINAELTRLGLPTLPVPVAPIVPAAIPAKAQVIVNGKLL